MNENKNPLIIFDGYCNLCSSTVQFVIKEDKKKIFNFLPSEFASVNLILTKFHLTEIKDKSIILCDKEKVYLGSTAILKILIRFGGYYKFFAYLMFIIPKPIRDFVYYFISRNRYKWFGKRESCFLVEEKD
ncbi:MAG: DCC1-like thiol-disulfide oxidoreductase family protein [bacterium]